MGDRPKYSSYIAALLDIIISDIHKTSDRTLVKWRNDTMVCFDHMSTNLIALYSRACEVPDNVYKLQEKTLQTIKYKVQTALGISKEHYQHSDTDSIYGSEQGAGHSTGNWLFHSTQMIKKNQNKLWRLHNLHSKQRHKTYTKHILGFLDDKSQYANDWDSNNIKTIIKNKQHAAQSWEELLHTSGGKLEILKCCIIVMDWTHGSKGSQVLLPTNKHNTISVIDSEDHKSYDITLLQNNAPFKYLRIISSTDDDQTSISNNTFGNNRRIKNINHHPLQNYQAKLYLFTHLNPKINYPLSCASLSHKQYNSFHKTHISNAI